MEEKFIKLCRISNYTSPIQYQSIKISRDVKYLCLHQLNNQVVLYYLTTNHEHAEGPIWESSNVNSCIFSDDGSEFIVMSNKNCCKIYSLLETSIVLLQEISQEELSLILGEFDIELTPECNVKLHKYNKKMVILFVNNKWLFTMRWSGNNVLLARNKIEVASCIKISLGQNAIYTLTAGGNVSAYDQNDGRQLGVVHLYAMIPPSRAMDVLSFKHLSVNLDGTSLAVSDRASQVFLVKLKNEFSSNDDDNEQQKWDCGTSVMSFGSGASHVTTTSHIQPKIVADTISLSSSIVQEPAACRSYKVTWNSYLQSLFKLPSEGFSGDQYSCMQKMPDPPPGLTVRALQLANEELSVWYTEPNAQSGGIYYLHDLASDSYIEQSIPDDTIVISGGLVGLKDAFLSPRGLYMFLGTLSHDILVSKMLHCMQRESLGRILQGESWSTLTVPLPAVNIALKQQQLDVIQLALNLHAHGLKCAFANVESDEKLWKDKLKKIVSDLEDLLRVIQETCSEYSNKPAFREQLIVITLEQTNRVLEFLYKSQSDVSQEFIQLIMDHVIQLRKYLVGQSTTKKSTRLRQENVLYQNQLSTEWQNWMDISDEAVIQDAIMKNCIPLSQVFLIQVRTWPPDSINSRYHKYIDSWVSSLLRELNIDMAEMILLRFGKDPDETLLNTCVNTEEQKLRDLLAQYLLERGSFPSTEMNALTFVKQIEEILAVVDFSRLGVGKDVKDEELMNIHSNEDKISLSRVLEQTNEWRQYVLISLFFNVPGAGHLQPSLHSEFVWLYLFENSREDLLCTWITCFFSEYPWESIPLCIEKWAEKLREIPVVIDVQKCKYISSTDLLNIFEKWPITEEMVNSVSSANAMPTLKELILNHLSRFGVFCFHERTDARAILKRMIFTGNVNNLEKILNQKHANVSYTDFKLLVTRYLISNDLYQVAFPCLEDFDYSEDHLEILCSSNENENNWFPLWLAFREMKRKPNDHSIVYETILKNAEYLAKGSLKEYLKNHPLVVLSLLVFDGKSFAEVFTSKEGVANLDWDVLSATLTHYPMLERAVTNLTNPSEETPDITLYQLLEGNVSFDISKLFGWQDSHRIEGEEFPHFTSPKLVEKYGIEYKMSYFVYLKLARPCFAACRFIIDQYKTYATLSQKRIKDAVNVAHGLALQYFDDLEITSSCLAFTEILGEDSSKLKVDLCSITKVFNFLQNTEEEKNSSKSFGQMVHEMHHHHNSKASANLLHILEKALAKEILHRENFGKETIDEIAHWGLAVKFARSHELKLPEVYLRQLTSENNLFLFLLFIEIYSYPHHQVSELSASFSSLAIQEHLFHILQVEVECEKPEKLHLKPRDIRKTLYSKVLPKKPKFKQDEQLLLGKPKKISRRRRETEQTDQQKEATSKVMDLAASLSSGSSGEEAIGSSLISYDVWGVDEKDDLFLVLLKCHSAEQPLQALLEAAYSLQNPILAVLATCYDTKMVVPCFCIWIIVSLPIANSEKLLKELNKCSHDLVWTEEDVLRIMKEAVSLKYIRTLQHGCWIFFPDNPLIDLMDFLYEAIIMKDFEECLLKMKSFKAAYLNLKNNDKNETTDFINDSLWLGHVAVELCKTTITSALTSLQFVMEFLAILCDRCYLEHLPDPIPDFERVERLVKSVSLTGVFPKMEALISPANSLAHKNEVNRCLQGLLQSKQFSCALQLAAAGDLNKDPVLMAQWSDKFEQSSKRSLGRDFMGFWKKCNDTFHTEKVHPHTAAKFLEEHAEKLNDMQEKFRVLQLAVVWLQEAFLTAEDSDAAAALDLELASLELSMWNCWLQAPSELPINIEDTGPEILYKTKSKILEGARISKLTKAAEVYTEEEQRKIHTLVGKLLDMGNIVTACRVEAMYDIKNQDLLILLLCLELAEGTLSPYELTAEQRLLFSETSTVRTLTHRRRALLSSISALSHSPGTNNLLVDYVEIPPRDKQDTLTSLEKLTGRLEHGVAIGNRIVMCYRVAMNLDLSYLNVLLMREPLNLLKTALADDCLNKFIVASDIITAAQINSAEVADFMAQEILEAITKSKLKGEVSGTLMWGIELESCFHLVLDICRDQAALGDRLLALASKTTSLKVYGFHEAHVIAVELVIHAHNCFVAALNMEGISSVLQWSQSIVAKLQKKEEWGLMVRLLSGVERYTEMNYILKILYENEQFEYLLAKGLDKVKGLKVAVIDFLKKRPGDRKLYEMVTLRFSMFEEVAILWESDGLQEQDEVLKFVLKDSSNDNVLCLPNTDVVRKHLVNVTDYFKHAAEFFIKGELLIRAIRAVHNAELVALQRFYIGSVPPGQNAPLLLGLNSERISHLVTYLLPFPHAYLVVRAYEHPVDWAAALYQHCVLEGDNAYFTSFTASIPLNSSLIEDIVRRFQVNKNITSDNARMMKKFIERVDSVELKYRLASQLGFRDLIESLLNGPEDDVAYLKDTVWQHGFRS